MIQLEKFRGMRTKHQCPSCGARQSFVRYVGDDGRYLASDVGKCDRASKCNYHKTPKDYFLENPTQRDGNPKKSKKPGPYHSFAGKNTVQAIAEAKSIQTALDYIPFEAFKKTLSGYDRNNLVKFLLDLFCDTPEKVNEVIKNYLIGTYEDFTCLPVIDRQGRICKAKLIRFNPQTGKRRKENGNTSSLPAKLKLKEDFQYNKNIFFGAHLLNRADMAPIAVVESEKTCLIGSLCMPSFIWLGSHSKTWLKPERLLNLGKRSIVLFPDGDAFDLWQQIAREANRMGAIVRVSTLIETASTAEQKAAGFDLADLLIGEQREINETNKFIDSENTKLERIKNDPELNYKFNMIIDERCAILMESGKLSEEEAERICTTPENVWRAIRSMGV